MELPLSYVLLQDYNREANMNNETHSKTPAVTVIIPTFNEQNFIVDCLGSIMSGNYPAEKLEILVIDGGSTDNTCELVSDYSKLHQEIRLVYNDKKIVPAAINLGLAQAKNEVIVWLGAHALYEPDYIVNSVRVLLEEQCASVGGIIIPHGKTITGKAIATATSSKFGIGNAKYRYATKREIVDTVFGGCWMKSNALIVGGFNERWIRNQDYEFNCRLREHVGNIILDPTIRCTYFCRETIRGLAKQYFQYGFWRFQTFAQHNSSFTIRQAAPLLLLISLIFSLYLIAIGNKFGYLTPLIYSATSALISIILSIKGQNIHYFYLLPTIFATLHFSWALGFAKGVCQNLLKKDTINSL